MSEAPLTEVEAAVQRSLATGDDGALGVLGYGEISLVVGWPADAPAWACKRLPVFEGSWAADRYGDVFARYLEVLGDRGVEVLPSTFETLPGADGGRVGYVVQPVLDPATLGPEVLRAADPDPDHPLVRQVCRLVVEAVDARVGLDAQISNWAMTDAGAVRYLDVTTPLLFDADGRLELDLDLFLAAFPWALRPPIRRFVAPGVADAYRDRRSVLVDLAANLFKERLDGWVPAVLDGIDGLVEPKVTVDEVRRHYRSDARLWETMLRLRRADRWWQRRVRRRSYPFLLPGPVAR